MDVCQQEIFGHVLSAMRVDNVDEAIALINTKRYGNGTAIFTSSGESVRRFQRGAHVGMIGITTVGPALATPAKPASTSRPRCRRGSVLAPYAITHAASGRVSVPSSSVTVCSRLRRADR